MNGIYAFDAERYKRRKKNMKKAERISFGLFWIRKDSS